MDYENVIQLTSQAMLLCLLVSLPVVLVAAGVGLLVSFVQAITSLQDATIGQAAKLIAVTVTLLLAAPWGAAAVFEFAQSVFKTAVA
ncbi:type III secretion system export apparatus subunit SctS [Caldimonas brevitalea]|uniref:Aldolase n=1 Tax=Caldimonas brevitalea TaxID=413882 RepID=A0A0G3BIM2_9BURK|nr:type III secretion system export apparatus subunit SctS [Caldimonas brevitalea]AKJ27813.1 aldolase [Caldimonas brevitalea]